MRCHRDQTELVEDETEFTARGITLRDARGLRCPKCGEVSYTVEQLDVIHCRLGEEEAKKPLTLRRSSRGHTVSLPREALETLHASPGDKVTLTSDGDKLTLERVKEQS